jgi:NTP pyrophosphatase (non-canonical NTP hydrolase)
MDFNKYQELAARTLNSDISRNEKLSMLSMGLAGEAGEVVDLLKKHVYHQHHLDVDKLRKELGDVLWYIAGLATINGMPMSIIAEVNVAKLKERYPDGFDVDRSINRKGEE